MSVTTTLTRALAQALARHTQQSFGLMGNGNAHFIDDLSDVGICYTAVRHEAGAVAAADAFTRVSGKLALATTTYGAGFTNALTALAEAVQARTPILVVVGDAPSGGPRLWDVDQEMLAAAMGVRTHLLSVTNIDRIVDRAVSYALRQRRPVVLGIPYDLITAEVVTPVVSTGAINTSQISVRAPSTGGIDLSDPAVMAALSASAADVLTPAAPAFPTPTPRTPPTVGLAHHQLETVVLALREAERPLIIAGRGAHLSAATSELGQLAEVLGAVTATTALGRGIFPAPEFDLGVTGGFGQHRAMRLIAESDVVVVVGAGLNQFTMRFGDLFGPGTTLIRIDDEPLAPPKSNHPITHVLLQGDAKEVLGTLLGSLCESGVASSGWRERVIGLEPGGALRTREGGFEDHSNGICVDGRLDPRSVATRIGEMLPEQRHVTSDGGHFIGWANMYWPVASPERMIMVGAAYQTIGLGLPTVAGIAAAAPDSTVVLSMGDGGGLMALADLETAIRTANSCVIVVWNDGAYSAEVHLYGAMGLNEAPMLIPDINFADIATALGAQGITVRSLSDLDALGEWVSAGSRGTILLDCRVSRSIVAEYQREIQRVNGIVSDESETPK